MIFHCIYEARALLQTDIMNPAGSACADLQVLQLPHCRSQALFGHRSPADGPQTLQSLIHSMTNYRTPITKRGLHTNKNEDHAAPAWGHPQPGAETVGYAQHCALCGQV